MDIHTKKWKKLLKKTPITAEVFIDEIRENIKLERIPFRHAFYRRVFPWTIKNRICSSVFLRSSCRRGSSSFSESVDFY